MAKDPNRIEKGEIVMLSSGAYSDYMQHGLFRALRWFHPKQAMIDVESRYPDDVVGMMTGGDVVASRLCRAGYLEPVDPPTWRRFHVTNYGTLPDSDTYVADGWL